MPIPDNVRVEAERVLDAYCRDAVPLHVQDQVQIGYLVQGIMPRIVMRSHLDIISAPGRFLPMRTTLSIDDDLLAAAKTLARDRSESVGKVISDLARRGLNAAPRVRKAPRGSRFPVFEVPRDARRITAEDVRRAEDEA